MPDVYIKTPNLDAIFDKWKSSASRKNKKKLEKEFGTKGAVFSLNAISAAESVKDTMKEAAIYYEIKKTIAPVKGKKPVNLVPAPRMSRETFYSFKGGKVNKDNWKGKEKVPIIETIKGVQCKNEQILLSSSRAGGSTSSMVRLTFMAIFAYPSSTMLSKQ